MNVSRQVYWWNLIWEDHRGWIFSLEEVLLWIINSFCPEWLEVKNVNYLFVILQKCSFSLQMMLTDRLESCRLPVDYCDVFISCLDTHSDGTHSL